MDDHPDNSLTVKYGRLISWRM